MEIRLRGTGQVLSEGAFRALHSGTSFPPVMGAEVLGPLDADVVLSAPAPTVARYQTAARNGAAQDGAGNWVQEWVVQNWSQDQIDAYRADAIASAWAAIKAKRTVIKDSGAKVGTKWFQTDSDSRIQYLGLKDKARDAMMAGGSSTTLLYQLGQPIQWKTYDNSFVQVTVQLAIDIVAAVSDLDAGAFGKAEQHRMAMSVAPDPATYDFSGGWPAVYQG